MRITWSPRVTGDERAEFERKVRDEGIEGYQIKAWVTGGTPASAPQENEYFPVLYSTGIPTALSVLGVDLNTEPNRGDALEHARDGDRMCPLRPTSNFAIMAVATGVAFSYRFRFTGGTFPTLPSRIDAATFSEFSAAHSKPQP
jgi:hypothetical protein